MNGTRKAEVGITYMTWTIGFPVDTAKKIFERKHGAQPHIWFFDGNTLKVGPIPPPVWMRDPALEPPGFVE